MEALCHQLSKLVEGYPLDASALSDGLLDRLGFEPYQQLLPGPALGLVQVGWWEEEEHHPSLVLLDMDPRRLRRGRLDVLCQQSHWGPLGGWAEVRRAWMCGGCGQEAALGAAWAVGHRCAAVAVQLAALRSSTPDDFLGDYSSPGVRALLDSAIKDDPLSSVLHYVRYRRFKGAPQDPGNASLALPLLHCHTWGRGHVSLRGLESALGFTAAFHPAAYGDLAALADSFTLDARRAAVDREADPERALQIAVDWAHDTQQTDAALAGLLRPLAERSQEPIWLRLCEQRS